MKLILVFLAGIFVEVVFSPRLDWDRLNKQLFLWYNWGEERKNIKLYGKEI